MQAYSHGELHSYRLVNTNIHSGYNYNPFILKEIGNIHFVSLKNLFFPQNGVESVEALPLIKMENLEMINIGINLVHYAKSFRKANWPNLTTLNISRFLMSIDGNKILEGNWISEMQMNSVSEINVEWFSSQNEQIPDIRCALKSSSKCASLGKSKIVS